MKNWEQESAYKSVLDERRHERLMEYWGIRITAFLLGVAVTIMAHAFIISLTLR